MILCVLRVVVSSEKRGDALELLNSLIGPIEVEPGFISYGIYQDLEDNNTFMMTQQWKSKAQLERHIGSEDFRKVLALMDLSSETPEINIHDISGTGGFEIIEKARGIKA